MQQYIERILHQNVLLDKYVDTKKLPLASRKAFDLLVMVISGQECLLACPIMDMNLTELRKQHRTLERLTGYYCAFYLKTMNYYAKEKMIEEGIPFVWENHQVYLPFLGILLNQNEDRTPKVCEKISFLTQKLILTAIYEDWKEITVTKAAKRLNVSKMSITRCFDEIQSLELPYLRIKSRARTFSCCSNKRKMWNELQPYLRSPVITEFRLAESIEGNYVRAGITALSEYSLINENNYPTIAVEKSKISDLDLSAKRRIPKGEEPVCLIQEVGYLIPFGKYNAMDPLSLAVTLRDAVLEDPRIEMSVDEMLEEYVW